ncbi:hypothetical protein ACK6ST_16845 [Proteus terrae]|uniref:hypothetical protein n=1 Tax=Proteus terrae TaxID=1574161 RepID=UPI003C2ED123
MDIYDLIKVEIKKSILYSEDYEPTKLQQLLDTIYDDIYKSQDSNYIRISISKLSHTFHSIGDSTIAILVMTLMSKLDDLNGVKTLKHIMNNEEPVPEKLASYIKSDFIANNGKINFLSHKKGSTTLGKRKLYSTISSMLKYHLRDDVTENDDISIPMILLVNMWEISPKINRLHEFYIMYCSFLHKLHFKQQNQIIRDLAETSLLLGIRNKTLHYSFYVRMAVYSRQFNIIDSLLSAQLMIHGYNYVHQENEIFLSKCLLELFISLRNFRLFPYANQVKQAHDGLNIEDPYDKHQFDMAVFNMKLIMEDEELFKLANKYLEHNDVLEFDVASGIPWLILLLNLKRWNSTQFESFPFLINSLCKLESHEDLNKSSVIVNYKIAMSSEVTKNKEAVRKSISNILQSRSFTDVCYELTTIQPIVINLLKNSIRTENFEGILIAHALSSGPLGFDINTEETSMGLIPIKEDKNLPSLTVFDNYLDHISVLMDRSDQSIFLWVGSCDDFCYSVSLKQKKFSLYINSSFSKADLRKWELSQTELLAFNDHPRLTSILDSHINHWEQESNLITNSLPIFTDIIEANNIILFRDVNTAYIPPNLIKTTSNLLLADLAPLHIPSSVELYIRSTEFNINSSQIKLWAPIEEGDYAINIAFDKIQMLFNDNSLLKFTTLNPEIELNKDINIFISHGGKDQFHGFKSISPSENKYFINEQDIFGIGKIAILFICHSGSSHSSMFATKLDGLVSKVLDLGYECVLAPAWSYNVILTGIWTRNFIDALNNGENISNATYHANMSVKSQYPSIGAYAAMHLFGNDNLTLVNSQI